MKFIHLSDLHLGKRVNDYSMIEDQRYILDKIIGIIREEKPQAVLIAGDVYDKPVPPAEAVTLFDDFISELAGLDLELFIISGNHDSAERLSFGSRIMDSRGIHFAGGFDGSTRMFSLDDDFGKVNFYMLPFIKPVHVRAVLDAKYGDEPEKPEIKTFTDAVSCAIDMMGIDESERNVLMLHQFVTGAQRCESEDVTIGGLDNVDAVVLEAFDYTALGHLHGPQSVGSQKIRYCGTPLKYSFSEVAHKKSVTIVELGEKKDGECRTDIRTVELVPMRDMRELRGTFRELTDKYYYKDIDTNDYMRITLTDEEDVIGALASLRAIYPNIMRLDYDNQRTRAAAVMPEAVDGDARTPLEIFAGLYREQNGKEMDEEQTRLISGLIEKVWSSEE